MEGQRRSSSRRKPLADCTNTIAAAAARRKFTPLAAKSTAGNPKPSISAVTKPSPKPPTSSSSIKTTTSTGSNNTPNVGSALSTPHSYDPPAPSTPLSDSGSRDRRKIGPSAAQSQQDEKTRKDKGNRLSETPIIQGAKPVTRQALMRSSSTASGNCHLSQKSAGQMRDGKMFMETLNTKTTKHSTLHASLISSSAASGNCHLSGPPAVQNKKPDVEKRKDHEEMVLEAPNIETSEFLGCHVPQASSSAASGNCHVSGPSAVQDPKLDAQRRKEKGKMVLETPIIEITDLLNSHVPMASSCAASGNWHCSEPPFQDQNLNGQKMNDKGKMVLETPNIEATDLLGSHKSLASSSAASGYCHLPGSPAVQNEKSDAQKRKDKGKMVLEAPIIEITDPLRPHISMASSSAASGNFHLSGFPAVPNQKMDARKWKDKGKVVLKTPNIATTDLLRPLKSLASSSAALGDGHLSGPPAVQNKKLDNQASMDKGNWILETQTIETIDSGRLQVPLTSSSAACHSDYLLGPPLVEYHKLDVAKSKDKGKMVQETLDIEATDPSTPQASLASSFTTSGACDQDKPVFLTVYNQRRALRRRKHADGKSVALSCPPNKRTKNMGMGLGDGSGKKKSGSHTDPLPVRKKSRKNHDDPVHIMPLDEIERLRAYYAEIDAFELTEEVAADSD